VVISSGFAMAIASAVCGLAQGKAIAAAVKAWPAIPEPPRRFSLRC
jgi:F0F1-type ATP synthase membrane subunit c/vacuolar-type H+-ATPase subunit K